jgi:23S rRNA (cytidine1920-2'-O)/16S rRNA (cytidine1409-2'-O)-methyltransferase
VRVDGRVLTNPDSLVRTGCALRIRLPAPLRGEAKLEAALDGFGVDASGRVALDVGAAAGGFTKVLISRGAALVYAVDAGHGQLLGSLRQDRRVVNLEATNLGKLSRRLVRHPVEVVTVDLSYLSVAAALSQIDRLDLAPRADLVALIKPMFELALPRAPSDRETVDRAVQAAVIGAEASGWRVMGQMESPVLGARGAREALIHGRRL